MTREVAEIKILQTVHSIIKHVKKQNKDDTIERIGKVLYQLAFKPMFKDGG